MDKNIKILSLSSTNPEMNSLINCIVPCFGWVCWKLKDLFETSKNFNAYLGRLIKRLLTSIKKRKEKK